MNYDSLVRLLLTEDALPIKVRRTDVTRNVTKGALPKFAVP